jgi:hypothetical protein
MKKLVEFIKDSPDSKLSSSRLWFNVANLVATLVYLYVGYYAVKDSPIDITGLAWYSLVYMGVVTGNKFANKVISARYNAVPQANQQKDTELEIDKTGKNIG